MHHSRAAMDLRIRDNAFERPDPVTITVDGAKLAALPGETLATALIAAGVVGLRSSPRAGTPRGPFCLMGVCQECVIEVDGRRVVACQTLVRAGMRVSLGGTG